ncbi:MAG: chemotaxis protein [Eubacteriales bacterium]|nr:chemotaxis protein [Lachnospiraceae bacterium]MDO5126508.1 chemotaxis protein [Eubacteriales bacterium]
MDSNILLESGTNEFEVLEFIIEGNHYGINVEKVREILSYQDVTPIPNSHPCIEGVFMPRGDIITVIDLFGALGYERENREQDFFIITNFNNLNIAFDVESVIGIQRVSWSSVIKPDSTISSKDNSVATGIIKKEDGLVIILDFERIVEEICPETSIKLSQVAQFSERERNEIPIMLVEDSMMLCRLVEDALNTAGYTRLKIWNNGQEAWDYLQQLKRKNGVDYDVKCIITDIEMPRMDGHHLIKLIRSTDGLKHIPIVVFSSLINEEMRRKGEYLGADAQISKPDIGQLVSILDELVAGNMYS